MMTHGMTAYTITTDSTRLSALFEQPGLDEHAADQKNEKQLGNLLR